MWFLRCPQPRVPIPEIVKEINDNRFIKNNEEILYTIQGDKMKYFQ